MKRELIKTSIEVRKSFISGYGVFATKAFKKGEIIEECPVLIINPENSGVIFSNYSFNDSVNEQSLLPLGYGCLYNHANLPNCVWNYDDVDKIMTFKALKNIYRGEELVHYYSATWLSKRGIVETIPRALSQRVFTFFSRIAFILLIFFILKLAFFPPKDNFHKKPAVQTQTIHSAKVNR